MAEWTKNKRHKQIFQEHTPAAYTPPDNKEREVKKYALFDNFKTIRDQILLVRDDFMNVLDDGVIIDK